MRLCLSQLGRYRLFACTPHPESVVKTGPDGYSCWMFFEANKSHFGGTTLRTMPLPMARSSGGEQNNGEQVKLDGLTFILLAELCSTSHMRLCACPEKAFHYGALMAVAEIFAALQQHDSAEHPIHRYWRRRLRTNCLREAVDNLSGLLAMKVPK